MDTEPFCGRYVLKNPYRIYRQASDEDTGIMLSMFGTVNIVYIEIWKFNRIGSYKISNISKC